MPPEDLECWLEEVGLDPHVRGLTWQRPPSLERLASFSVVVIGAGMGGLNAAVQLEARGHRIHGAREELRRSAAPGSRTATRARASTLPAVRTPTSSVWASTWRPRSAIATENQRYFNRVADDFDVRRHIVFDTEVVSL